MDPALVASVAVRFIRGLFLFFFATRAGAEVSLTSLASSFPRPGTITLSLAVPFLRSLDLAELESVARRPARGRAGDEAGAGSTAISETLSKFGAPAGEEFDETVVRTPVVGLTRITPPVPPKANTSDTRMSPLALNAMPWGR